MRRLVGAHLAAALALGSCGAESGIEAPAASTSTTTVADPAGTTAATTDPPAGNQRETSEAPLAITTLPEALADWRPWADRHVDVFGVNVVALPGVSEDVLRHAAGVMAQYLDNDADGHPDAPAVVEAMRDAAATLVMAVDEEQLEESGIFESGLDRHYAVQDLYEGETGPLRRFDASLEEVHHLILDTGWGAVYPDRLGVGEGSDLTRAMDVARGGRFLEVPDRYPEEAWYHYDDETCGYDCMATEYAYWAHTSLLGAQADPDRCEEVAVEWRPCTADLLRTMDPLATALFADPELLLPTRLPDGEYRPAP